MATVIDVVETDTVTDTDEQPSAGWSEETPQCKRHRYLGGDVCLRCGTPRPVKEPSTRAVRSSDTPVATRGSGKNEKILRTAISMGWMGMGLTLENLPNRFEKLEPLAPVGRVMQFEAAIAGQRVSSALKKTPAWRPIMAIMSRVGPWSDLAPLVLPPVLVGLMSWKPSLRENPTINSMLVAALVPLMAETAEMAAEQNELVQSMQQFNEESVGAAMGMLDSIFGESTAA